MIFFDRNNIVHNCVLLFTGFAGVTDGKLSKREIKEIKIITMELLDRFNMDLNQDGEIDEEDFDELFEIIQKQMESFNFSNSKTFLERIGFSSSTKDEYPIEFVREVSYAITQIKLHPSFNNDLGIQLINGLNTIAHSDGNFDNEESRWIKIIKEELVLPF